MSDRSVTVIIPTHGRDVLLSRAITSVLRQSRAPLEVIVVDDLASEDTEQTVTRIAASTTITVRYARKPRGAHVGAGSSRNHGARMANGSALAFLDDDDTWQPSFVEQVITPLNEGAACAVAWADFRTEDSDTSPGHRMEQGLGWRNALAVNPGLTGSNFIITAAAFERIEGFDESLRVGNDKDFVVRLLREGFGIAVIRDVLVMQNVHGEGQLTSRTRSRAEGLRAYAAKYASDFSFDDRRRLFRELASVMRCCASTKSCRVLWTVGQVASYTPREAWSTLRRVAEKGVRYT